MKEILKWLNSIQHNDEQMFKIFSAFKFTLISFLFAFIAFALNYMLLKIDLIFFESHGYELITRYNEIFYDFVFSNILSLLPWFVCILVITFLSGYYIAVIMIRPFKLIGIHCEERINGITKFYEPDFFSDLKLLTSFSSYFFSIVDQAKIKGKLEKHQLPSDYTNIHQPIIEKNFFINYLLVIIVFALLASIGIFILNNEIRESVLIIANKLVKNNGQVKFFLDKQKEVENYAFWVLLISHMVVNFIFGIHLYEKISSPAFAVFATLRSFLKGNYYNRIHLVGFYYLRNDCRKINKYLDKIQEELT